MFTEHLKIGKTLKDTLISKINKNKKQTSTEAISWMGLVPVDKDLYALVDSCGKEGVVLPQLGVAVVGKNSVSDQNVIRLGTG
jgi:hypothetical protein